MKQHTLALMLVCLATPVEADELGRFFFTPIERQTLDRARQTGDMPPSALIGGPVTVMHYEGAVTRSSGPSTAWINGVPQAGPLPNARLKKDGDLSVVDDGITYRIKPGQSLNLETGTVADPWQAVPDSSPEPPPSPPAAP